MTSPDWKPGIFACVTDVAAMTPTGGTVRVWLDPVSQNTLMRGLSLNNEMILSLTREEASVLRDLLTVMYPEA